MKGGIMRDGLMAPALGLALLTSLLLVAYGAGVELHASSEDHALAAEAMQDALAAMAYSNKSCDDPLHSTKRGRTCTKWDFCGKGFLLQHRGLVLAPWRLDETTLQWTAGEERTLNIVGLPVSWGVEGHEPPATAECDASKLTIFVGLSGPEMIGAVATPNGSGGCSWSVPLSPSLPGEFELEMLLMFENGAADPDLESCKMEWGTYEGSGAVEMLRVKESDSTWYGQEEACCELCSATPGCSHWTGRTEKTEGAPMCILYSSVEAATIRGSGALKLKSGVARAQGVRTYLGPSLYLGGARWCARENSRIYRSGFRFTVVPDHRGGQYLRDGSPVDKTLPLYPLLNHPGRWVEFDEAPCASSSTSAPHQHDLFADSWVVQYSQCNASATLQGSVTRTARPPTTDLCWIKDWGEHASRPYWWQPWGCRYEILSESQRVTYLSSKGISSFRAFGDSIVQMLSLDLGELLEEGSGHWTSFKYGGFEGFIQAALDDKC